MATLRTRLEQSDPGLHAALERSWQIALDGWLAATVPHHGSYNSAPHLRNMENYLDHVVPGFQELPSRRDRLALRPAEIYLLLAAVLFHDLGRAQGGTAHGQASKTMLRENWAQLGVPSEELARILGGMAAYHDDLEAHVGGSVSSSPQLHDVVVGPHGRLRVRPLAALIVLADNMDSAYTRAFPSYLMSEDPTDFKGQYRRRIRGIEVDHSGGLVRAVLGDALCQPGGNGNLPAEPHTASVTAAGRRTQTRNPTRSVSPGPGCVCEERLEDILAGTRPAPKQLRDVLLGPGSDSPLRPALLTERFAFCNGHARNRYHGLTWGEWGIARGKRDVKQVAAEPPVPESTYLALAMNDVRSNADGLRAIRTDLAAIGMPLSAWLIECQEHLYDDWGRETYEPVLDRHYLTTVADAMWTLSTGVFGWSVFAYEDLASAVGDPDVAAVRRAATRIAIVVRGVWDRQPEEERRPGRRPPLWTGATHWRWNVDRLRTGEGCACMHLLDVIWMIERTGSGDE